MKKTALATALSALVLSSVTLTPATAQAQEASPLSFNIGVVSDYRYRGISQTRLKPAVQGGADYAGPNGLYVGVWASTIKWIEDFGGDAKVEIDLYGGKKGEISKDLSYDVGLLQYYYPSNRLNPNANTLEAYGALTYGPVTAKYSHALTNTFGNPDSKGSYYLDLTASFDLGDGLMVAPHVGYQKITGPFSGDATYTDYSLTLSKAFGAVTPSISLVGTDASKSFYVPGPAGNSTKFLGKSGVVVGVKFAF